jgi:hypothetical protein
VEQVQAAKVARPASILDLEEKRFPLNLGPELQDIRDLWNAGNRFAWDPATAIPWDKFDAGKYTKPQLDAARLYWSRRAWTEYTGVAESPAVLLRLCMEPGREVDARIFWAMQTLEETRHCMASYIFAEKLGGYMSAPPIEPPRSAHHRGIRDKVLNPNISFEAFVLAHVCIGETVAAKMFEVRYKTTSDPVAKELIRLILKDETRHIQFGWRYMAHKAKTATPELIAEWERVAVDVVENSELKGFHCIWLVPSPQTAPLIEANNLTAEAGLGGSSPELEMAALKESIADIRRDMKPWGVTIPMFTHPVLGEV